MSGVSTVVQTRGNSLGTRYVDVMPGVSVYIKYTTSSLCKVHLPRGAEGRDRGAEGRDRGAEERERGVEGRDRGA